MVQYCKYCKKEGGLDAKKEGRTLHRFPLEDPQLLEIWREKLNLDESFRPTKYSRICSDHFKPECFQSSKSSKVLVAGSVPTIFNKRKDACFYCNASRETKPGLSLRRFPLDRPDLLRKWLIAININNFNPIKESRICSDHFATSCFQEMKDKKYSNLKRNAVPTIFFREQAPLSSCSSVQQSSAENCATSICSIMDEQEPGVDIEANNKIFHLDETDLQEVVLESLNITEENIDCNEDSLKIVVEAHRSSGNAVRNLFESVTPSTKVSTSATVAKSRRILQHDHSYAATPRSSKRKLLYTRKILKKERLKSKARTRIIKRLSSKTKSLKDIVIELRKRNSISESGLASLESIADSDVGELFKRFLKNRENVGDDVRSLSKTKFKSRIPSTGLGISREKYPPALRSFAMTLHFYSPKAYNFIRQKFCRALPDPSTLKSWYSSINGEPGFTTESFEALKIKVAEASCLKKKVICSLMLDEISIKCGLQNISVGKIRGYVDFGSETEFSDEMSLAKDALVLMVVTLDGSWKLPIGYFLINGIDSNTNAELIKSSLCRLNEVGVEVVSVTLDGPSKHFATMRSLGASLEIDDCRPHFPHPSLQTNVYVIFDPCHMLKLMRNCLGEYKILKDGDGNLIEWRYIEELIKLQENEGLRAGNKLKWAHLQYHKMKMKVFLAAQTLSSSVADSIEFCDKILNIEQFKGSEGTIRFIRCVDRIFDFLNSRNPLGKGYKAPLTCKNELFWRPKILLEIDYLKKISNASNILMIKTRRCVSFVGLITATLSIIDIFDNQVKPINSQLKYLLTYKLSQDHLELFFCAIRSCGGWCPNPTAAQFISAYKRLLIHHEVKAANGNVAAMDATSILSVPSSRPVKVDLYDPSIYEKMLNERVSKKYGLDNEERDSEITELTVRLPRSFSNFSRSCVGYISGWVVKQLVDIKKGVVKCEQCQEALFQGSQKRADFEDNGLIEAKTRGGLIFPSESVVRICVHTENLLRHSLDKIHGMVPNEKNFPALLCSRVMTDLLQPPCTLFQSLNEHLFDDAVDEPSHVYVLMKNIVTKYIKLRMFSATKLASEVAVGEKVRNHLNRQIIWQRQ